MIIHRLATSLARLFLIGLLGGGVAYAGESALAPEKTPASATEPAPAAPAPPVVATPENTAQPLAAEAKGLLALGTSLTDRKDFVAAEIAYRQILGTRKFSRTDETDALLGLARCYRLGGNLTKASAIFEKFLKQFPEDGRVPDAMLDLGRTLRAMGANKLALSSFYDVINSTLKLPTEGFDHYQQLAKTAQFEIAETHFDAGEFGEAAKFYARLRLLDLAAGDRARAHFKSAYSLQLSGDLPGAVTLLRSYLEAWPDDENAAEARYLLAITLRQLNRPEEAMAATLELLRTQQSGGNAHRWAYWQRRTGNQLANEFFQRGDTANALAIYEGLAALAPDPAWRLPILYQTALCQERLLQVERARTAYQAVIDGVAAIAASKTESGAPATPSTELNDLSRMAAWRLAHMEWTDQTGRKLTALFSTSTGQRPTPAAAPPKS